MARRRYISTDISTDKAVNRLACEAGDFAALLYTWLIPHAEDDGSLCGDPEELVLRIIPGLRHHTTQDVSDALRAMERLQLIMWDREEMRLYFPVTSFYKYQTYIKADNRRRTNKQRTTTENTENHRTEAENTVSLSSSSSSIPVPISVSDDEEEADAAIAEDGAHWEVWFDKTFCRPPTFTRASDIRRMVDGGMQHALVIDVLQAAVVGKKRNALGYATTVLGDLYASGVRTVTDRERMEKERSDGRSTRASPGAVVAAKPLPNVMAVLEAQGLDVSALRQGDDM